jgi:tellurite resistance protein
VSPPSHVTRRGALAGGALAAASALPLLAGVRHAFAQAPDEIAILKRAVTLELTMAAAYEAAASGGVLSPRVRQVALLFRRQEQAHADALSSALRAINQTAPTGTDDRRLQGLRGLRTEAEVVRFAIGLENASVAAYYDAQKKLRDGRLIQATAQVMANDAQHLVVLRQATGQDPLPEAFETGGRED